MTFLDIPYFAITFKKYHFFAISTKEWPINGCLFYRFEWYIFGEILQSIIVCRERFPSWFLPGSYQYCIQLSCRSHTKKSFPVVITIWEGSPRVKSLLQLNLSLNLRRKGLLMALPSKQMGSVLRSRLLQSSEAAPCIAWRQLHQVNWLMIQNLWVTQNLKVGVNKLGGACDLSLPWSIPKRGSGALFFINDTITWCTVPLAGRPNIHADRWRNLKDL